MPGKTEDVDLGSNAISAMPPKPPPRRGKSGASENESEATAESLGKGTLASHGKGDAEAPVTVKVVEKQEVAPPVPRRRRLTMDPAVISKSAATLP